MAKTTDVPKFGPLAGVKVLDTGANIAGPFGATLMAEAGATVLHVENSKAPDGQHSSYQWFQEHRNQLTMALDLPSPEGREVFFKLIEWADIWMESSKGGTYAKWGLTDEAVWEHNPKLAIVHTSGYGQTGVEEYVNQGSYDACGQAFSGYMSMNGLPDEPLKVNPYPCDYITGLNSCWTALACYIKAQTTGKGESVDVAQYETMVRLMSHFPMVWLNEGELPVRTGNKDNFGSAFSFYRCKDDRYVFIGMTGSGPVKRGFPIIGLPEPGSGDPDFPAGFAGRRLASPEGQRIEKAVEEFCAAHDSTEVEALMKGAKIPCQRVYNLEDCEHDPHFQAREVFTKWEDPILGEVRGVGLINKFKQAPTQIWRGAPLFGADNEDVLGEMGYSPEEIQALYEKKVIRKMSKEECIRNFRMNINIRKIRESGEYPINQQ